jgi:membrane protease YdiL (CAAX protease family)
MYAESAVYAAPLFVLMLVLAPLDPPHHPLPAAAVLASGSAPASWQAGMVFGIGAGIYEELLFRLIAIALIHAVLVDLLALPHRVGAAGAILLSSIAFALYHFPTWSEVRLDLFIAYAVAGLYLAAASLVRGFGVAAGTHAFYDAFAVLWPLLKHAMHRS